MTRVVGEMVGRGSRRERDEAFLERMYSYIKLHIVWDNRSHPTEHSTHATTPHTNHLFVSLYSIMKLVEVYTTDRSVRKCYDQVIKNYLAELSVFLFELLALGTSSVCL